MTENSNCNYLVTGMKLANIKEVTMADHGVMPMNPANQLKKKKENIVIPQTCREEASNYDIVQESG